MRRWPRRFGLWPWAAGARDAAKTLLVPAFRREERVRRRRLQEFKRSCAPSLRQPLGTTGSGTRRVLVMSIGFVDGIPIELGLLKALEMTGCEPVVLVSDDPWLIRHYRAAGVRRLIRWKETLEPVSSGQALTTLERVRSFEELLDLTHDGVRIGRFAASTALRQLRLGSLEVETVEGRRRLAPFLSDAMAAAAAARRLVQRIRPDCALLVDKGYTPQGQLFDACLAADIPVLTWNIGHRSNSVVFKRYRQDNRDDHPISLSPDSWEHVSRMPWTPAHRERLSRELRDTYASGEWYSEVGTQFNTRLMEPDELRRRLGLDPAKKTVVIFPHILWDGTFFFGRDLFRSYEEWFVETVRAACANDRVNWVIKIHPANVVKNARDGVIGEPAEVAAIRQAIGPLPSHVVLIPAESDINTFSLFGLMEACVTVRGTVGLEAASLGIPVLTGGTGRYDRKGFTIDPDSREEFLRLLGRIEELPPLSDEQRTLAERCAYGIFILRTLPLASVTFHYERDRTASLRTRIHPMTRADWLNAPDLSALARWVRETDEADFLMPVDGAERHEPMLAALVSPESGEPLAVGAVLHEAGGELLEGTLVDPRGQRAWPVRQGIPRFVEGEGYTANFGEQWNRYRRTQIDRWNGTTLSRDRLFSGTGWTPEELRGQRVLEVGCGAGRFTQVLLDAGAEVYAVDASRAVEACRSNQGPQARLCVVQADLYAMPFQHGFFDKILCYGVLQHTPDVKRAFLSLPPFLKPGGMIAIDVYNRLAGVSRINRWGAKRWWRPLTTRLRPTTLARIVEWYIPKWLPIDTRLARVPGLGRWLVSIVPCWNYTGRWPLTPEQIREWAILDTFDALSARYDQPQTLDAVRGWCEEAGLSEIDVRFGGNGLLGNARRPREAASAAHAEAACAAKESPSWR